MPIIDQPNNAKAVEMLQQKLLRDPQAFAVVVVGPSGVGKTTVCREVLKVESDVFRCATTTTRPPRPEEIEGVERHFVSHEAFLALQKQDVFIEQAEVHGHLYGATLDAVYAAMQNGRVMLMDVDVQGMVTWKKALKERCVTVFVLPPSLDKLKERLVSRQTENESHLQLRMENATEELRQADLCDYIIINDQVPEAVAHLRAIIQAERFRSFRMEKHLYQLGLKQSETNG